MRRVARGGIFGVGLLLGCPAGVRNVLPPSEPPPEAGEAAPVPRARADSALSRLADSDEDGILDEVDVCPKVPECVNGFDDEDGCPDEPPAEVAALQGVIESLVFETDKGVIRPESYAELDRIARTLIAYPQVRVEIQNHRAADGQDVYSRDITKIRANAVAEYLFDKGVRRRQLVAHGYGEEMPIDTNRTPEGRERNRRTELKFLGPVEMLSAHGCAPPQG